VGKVLGVGGVFLKAKVPSRLLGWYARHLGIKVTGTFASLKPAAMPKDAVTVLAFFPRKTRHFSPSRAAFMVALVVDDLDAVLEQVVRGGGKKVGTIQSYSFGRFGWFLDPDHNKVELWEPASMTRRVRAKGRTNKDRGR
jgi:predicted enzyme related to lactoylglutathione lyase